MMASRIPLSVTIPTSTPPLTPDSASPTISRSSLGSRRGSHLHIDFSTLSAIREPTKPTDTLIFTNIAPSAFDRQLLTMLKSTVEEVAHISSWIPLKSFMRVVISFASPADAINVRAHFDGIELLDLAIKIFYGENTGTRIVHDRLEVPALERNWLISPPGSPPVGWTQAREDPPNEQILHADLFTALSHLGQAESPTELCLLKSGETIGPEIVVHLDHSGPASPCSGIERSKVSMVRTAMPLY